MLYRAAKASIARPRRVRESSCASSSRQSVIPERRRRLDTPPDSTITQPGTTKNKGQSNTIDSSPTKSSPLVMLRVGPEKRLFAAHESILCASPYFADYCDPQSPSPLPIPHFQHPGKRIELPDESPEILSCVLEFLYKGDYYPRLQHNARRRTWELEDARADGNPGTTVYHHRAGLILRDTAIYSTNLIVPFSCAAQKYNLPTLQRLALRKQGLQTGIDCMPDTLTLIHPKLRAHYLALIIRSRGTFKRSGTMQVEMERGGRLFFDLFVAMCNHMDEDVASQLSVCSGSLQRY
ncbi:hypothetical protein VI817_005180 [Penicillium citrinum]|nr:hypothetical protein VI817_005180 [Penicillium citrinum]